MEILGNKAIWVRGLNKKELHEIRQEINLKNLNNIELKMYKLNLQGEKLEKEKLLSSYSDVFEKVTSLNLSSFEGDMSIVKYFKNLEFISVLYNSGFEKCAKELKKLENFNTLALDSMNFLNKDYGLSVDSLIFSFASNPALYWSNNPDEMISVDMSKAKNCDSVRELSFYHNPKFYAFTMTKIPNNLEKLSLVGNYNLTKINLSNNLKGLKELRIYGNNLNCEFGAEEIVSIIKNQYENGGTLTKFVFDLSLYPKISTLLKNEFKDERFLTFFDRFAYFGESADGDHFEIDAKEMRRLDQMTEKIISRCGITKNDTEYEAFAKLYLFVIDNVSYHKSYSGKSFRKYFNLRQQSLGSKNEIINALILGNGAKISSSLGGLKNDYQLVCGGVCRHLSYLLSKLGIKSYPFDVFASNDAEQLLDNRSEFQPYREINHKILRVDFNNGSLFVDPTYDLTNKVDLNIVDSLSFLDKNYFDLTIDNFMESKYYLPKKDRLSSSDIDNLKFYFVCEIDNMFIEDPISTNDDSLAKIKPILSDNYRTPFNHYIDKSIIDKYYNNHFEKYTYNYKKTDNEIQK